MFFRVRFEFDFLKIYLPWGGNRVCRQFSFLLLHCLDCALSVCPKFTLLSIFNMPPFFKCTTPLCWNHISPPRLASFPESPVTCLKACANFLIPPPTRRHTALPLHFTCAYRGSFPSPHRTPLMCRVLTYHGRSGGCSNMRNHSRERERFCSADWIERHFAPRVSNSVYAHV